MDKIAASTTAATKSANQSTKVRNSLTTMDAKAVGTKAAKRGKITSKHELNQEWERDRQQWIEYQQEQQQQQKVETNVHSFVGNKIETGGNIKCGEEVNIMGCNISRSIRSNRN